MLGCLLRASVLYLFVGQGALSDIGRTTELQAAPRLVEVERASPRLPFMLSSKRGANENRVYALFIGPWQTHVRRVASVIDPRAEIRT